MTKKIGLMGCGSVASFGHLPAIAETAGVTLHAIFDPDPQKLAEFQPKYNVPNACTNAEAFFATGLDGVVIASPAPVHEENVLQCASHKLPVLCEKPLSMDAPQGRRMIDAMNAAGVPLYVAFCYRFSLAAMHIRDLVHQGAIGELKAMRLIYNWDCHGKYHWRDPAQGEQDRRRGRMLEGGPMVDCGTHQIDLAQWWSGSPVVKHQGFGAWADTYEAPDHTWAHLDHANGTHTMVEISYSYAFTAKEPESSFKYELIGTEGVIIYDRNISRFELRNNHGTFPQQYHEEKGFHAMHHAFALALETGQAGDLPTAEEGLVVTDIATDVTRQAMQGRVKAG